MPTRITDRERIRRLVLVGEEVQPREEYEFEHIAGRHPHLAAQAGSQSTPSARPGQADHRLLQRLPLRYEPTGRGTARAPRLHRRLRLRARQGPLAGRGTDPEEPTSAQQRDERPPHVSLGGFVPGDRVEERCW